MKATLIIVLALCLTRVQADTTEAESVVFGFDTRDSAGTTEAVSGVLGLDARNLGNSASSASGVFALGTQGGNLDALIIDIAHAPTNVVAGQSYAFPALASFAGGGGAVTDVSTSAKWFIVGEAPVGTRFEGNRLIGGNVKVPTVVQVAAVFNFPSSGMRESLPVEVSILPAVPDFKIWAWYSSSWSALWGTFTLTCDAATNSPQGAATPQNISWDLDQDGEFDDAVGLRVSQPYPPGQTIRVGVRAEWPLGVGPAATATSYFFVTFNRAPVVGEPPQGRAVDVLNGVFMDSDGEAAAPLESRKTNGLVVLTHGLWGAGTDEWLQEMRDAIQARLSSAPPNVVIYDWAKMSDPTAYRTNGNIQGDTQTGILRFDDFVIIRPYGKSQGVLIADWIDRQRQLGRVDRSAKIHLIGHSAGGFAMGECASLLNQRLYNKVQVTMLDTPLPFYQHIRPAWRTERYISSWIGGDPQEQWQADLWNEFSNGVGSKVDRFDALLSSEYLVFLRSEEGFRLRTLVAPGPKYYRKVVTNRAASLEDRHSASHSYYQATITNSGWEGEVLGDGFNQSLLVNDADFSVAHPPQAAPQQKRPERGPPSVPPMEGFSTFGDVQQSGSLYQVTEAINAGIFKHLTLPVGATTLQFQLQVTTPGDGDFVGVYWNDEDAQAIIPETSLAYDAPLLHEIDLTGLGGQTGTLTLKLISRGVGNSSVKFSEIRILESADVDDDGLSNLEEDANGSDVFEFDTDGDGLLDGEEVHTFGTDPTQSDTDGDGQDDATELAAGTDPKLAQSRFAAFLAPGLASGPAQISWNGVAGRTYRVVRSQELGTLNVDFLQGDIEGANGMMTYTDPNPPPLRAFYWIEVE